MALERLPIKKLVEFRRLSKRRKLTFANNLKIGKKPSSDGGGNYWVRSVSALSNAFKDNDTYHIVAKIEEVTELYNLNQRSQTKNMYKRNLDILNKYKNFDFSQWMPSSNLNFLKKPKSILDISGLPIQVLPNHIFSYGAKNNESVGGIWFVVWQEGFKPSDLGIYSECLYLYLSSYYSKDYLVNPAACLTVDIASVKSVGYNEILNGTVPSLFKDTMKSLKEFL